ncbi:MAG: calycin-like domain-containing protein [Bacteroidaceae bacterium]|nr:calycin-like domain-containing protein [Bacteroidaceae bacterium]
MKKFLLMMLAFCLVPVMGMAETKTYTDNLVVTINDESTDPQPTSILFTDNGDGTCNFALNNFCLGSGEDAIGVGNISLENLVLAENKGFSIFTYNGIINITKGDDPNIPADEWLGPMLGDVPLVLKGEVNDDKLYVSIDIDMTSTLDQMIYVKFGTDNVGYKEYTDNLVVTINDESTDPQPTTVLFRDNGDGTCNFALNNFCLGAGADAIGVGNIKVNNLTLEPKAGFDALTFTGIINISKGDDPNIPADEWLGPMLGDVPLVLKGEVSDDKIYVSIDIDMTSSLDQMIYVKLGTDNIAYKEYTDNLVVTINDESTDPQPTTVLFRDNGDGTCNFALNNFCLGAGADAIGVGNIKVDTLTYAVGDDGIGVFSCDRVIQISKGDDPSVDTWLGPILGDVPLILNGKITEDKVYVTIDINMESLGQMIHVTLGDDNFAPLTYTLTFLVEGDTIQTVDLEEGAPIEYPVVEERKGYSFAWDKVLTTMPAEDITITGAYTAITYTLTFLVEGDTIQTVELMEDDAIEYPQVEEREGYTFAWDKELTVMPAEATTITGTYTANIYKVTYMDGETVIASYEVAYGESLPEAPVYNREDDQEFTYTFEGWQGDVFTTMPAHDVVYTAIIKSTPTAIDAILASDGQLKVYDLQGRRVERPVKGIYVINGKKVMIK